MVRRLRLLWATLFALYCGSALAVGMSDLDLKSALNQRFDAEITLTKVGTLEIDEIIPNLASQSDFDRVGVTRNYELTDLRFKVVARESGDYVIQVTSSKPIIEPFLNFIVEVIWPTGRILREYTVLLDPPVFGTQGVEKIDPGRSGAPAAATPSNQASGTSTSPRRRVPPAPSVSSGRAEGVVTQDDEYGLTGPGDTLWTIAAKVRPDSRVSVQQTMLALQRANPEAFINNNINLLKAGHVLRIPDLDEIRAANSGEAIAEVRAQNEEFQDYKSGGLTQLDARRTSPRQSDSAAEEDDGELKLLAADQSGARSGADDARVADLEDALAVAREDLDRARRATSETNVRLEDLADQVETLNEIVTLKDDQLAALRAELQKAQAAPAAAPAQPATSTTPAGGLLANPMVLGGVGVVLIALIAGALILMRRRRQDSELPADDFPEVMMEEAEPELKLSDAVTDSEGDGAESEEAEEDLTQQTSDVIGEAEIYIAYGRFPQAISFLQNAIENEPDRADIQLKLLEVYVQTEDATAFNLQLDQLRMLSDDEATNKALELQAQIPGAAETSAASMDATIVSSEPIAAIEEPADDDDDLSFDLDDLDAETEDDDLSLDLDDDGDNLDDNNDLSLDEAMELGDADLDLDLDAAAEEAVVTEPDSDLDLDLDLDDEIDLDFDDDTSSELSSTQQLDSPGADSSDDIDLDLDDDLDISLDDDDNLDLDDTVALDSDALDLGDDDDALDLGDDDALELDLDEGDDDALELNLDEGDDDALELNLDEGDDDALELNLDEDDDDALELNLDEGDDDALELNLDDEDDDALELDLGEDDDALELNLDDAEDELGLDLSDDSDELSLDLDDDDAITLDLDAEDDIELDLGEDDAGLDDDGAIELNLDDDDELDLGDLDDELNLDEDAGSKLDLARAYIEMGDGDGARSLLSEVIAQGSEAEVSEANELMSSLD